MHIFLLTHSRELNKHTNTGSLVVKALGADCTIIVWDRVSPDLELLHRIENESVVLLYPSAEGEVASANEHFDSCIIIDGTWQEAKKIYNKSPYLKHLRKLNITNTKTSIYTLRRNQKEMGLCTAECAAQVLKMKGHFQQAVELEEELVDFIGAMLPTSV